jgi:stearoyl-CoA desaturase (delta-9 desaturase)
LAREGSPAPQARFDRKGTAAVDAPDQRRATVLPGHLDRPVSVARAGVLWRYAISLGAMHVLALLALHPWFFSWTGVAVFAAGVFVFGQGVNLCYHRLLAHRSLAVPKWLEHAFVALALCSMQDTPVKWVTAHRHHHKFSDEQPDAHSPRAGFLWSHMGWLVRANSAIRGPIPYQTYAHDLLQDKFYRRLERDWRLPVLIYLVHALLFFAAGFAIGWAGGTPAAGVQFGASLVVWGVILRTVAVWHITWSVNSFTHVFGYRTYATPENSRNNWVLGLLAAGEGWHNNHHHDQASASNRHRWWEFDLTFCHVWLLERLGLATNVIRPRAQRHAGRNRA